MFNVPSGQIQPGRLYLVAGEQSVIYEVYYTIAPGQTFRGVDGVKNFYFDGSGSALVYEVLEFKGGSLQFEENEADRTFELELTELKGMALELELTEEEKIVQETTIIKGMSLELIDFPFYSFVINELR